MASVARRSAGRFLPDQLVTVERGESSLDDSELRFLTDLYGLAARPWARAAALGLMVDRTPARSGATPVPLLHDMDHDDIMTWVACRLVALSVLVGLDMASGPLGLDGLAEVVECPLAAAVERVDTVLGTEALTIGSMVESMLDRVVVPEVGLLVAETDMGSLLLVSRSAGSEAVVPACGTLFELIDAAR